MTVYKIPNFVTPISKDREKENSCLIKRHFIFTCFGNHKLSDLSLSLFYIWFLFSFFCKQFVFLGNYSF